MKLYKYLLISLAALCFTACSDDDNDWNTAAGVTVSMKEAQMDVIESMGIFGVPIEVTGNPNGPVRVTVEVAENGVGPAMENVHYIVTSKTINISASEKVGQVEIETIDDWDINDPRSFTVTIKNVEGASVGSIGTTTVNLIDEDDQPYNLMRGTWQFCAIDLFDNEQEEPAPLFNLTIQTPDPKSNDYGKKLYAYGFDGDGDVYVTLKFKYDELTQTCSVSVPLGSFMSDPADPYKFNGIGDAAFKSISLDANTLITQGKVRTIAAGKLDATVNADLTEIQFSPMDFLGAGVYTVPNGEYAGYYSFYYVITMKKL